jgi:threonine dehydrogenase-like Zn-dependent dehydrogenase
VRAVRLDSDGLPELADISEPDGPGTLVHVRACGLCGSDVEKLGVAVQGTVLGHEIDGVLETGERVAVLHRVACGACRRCRAGHESTCDEFRLLRIAPGGFSERLRSTHYVRLPDSLEEQAGIWVEPLACILRAAPLVPRGRVLAVGCGSVGLLWIQVLLARGDDVIAADPRPERLAAAARLGAETAVGPVDGAVLTAPPGLGDALDRLEPGGTLLVFAAPAGPLPVALDAVYRRELRVVGSRSATPESFEAAIELLPSLSLPEVTTLPLERFAEGVELYRRGGALKVVFTP